jgi:VIT1/CCC1 family predicted Fe2+/Mn2+ transporter
MESNQRRRYIQELLKAWHQEQTSERVYRDLAAHEGNPERRSVLIKLAEVERRHGEQWTRLLEGLGALPAAYRETLWERIWRWMLVQSGTNNALARIESAEEDDAARYVRLAELAGTESEREAFRSAQRDEIFHSQAAKSGKTGEGVPVATSNSPRGLQSRLDSILGKESWHHHSGGWIGQVIYGANDGLGSVFGIVSGVAGATAGGPAVLIAGLAGMLASALSMGSGAYLATKSQREVYEAEIRRERRELETHPDEEQEELELFYQLKGLPVEVSRQMAAQLIGMQGDAALTTLANEELGLSEQTFPNPWKEAISATLSTAFGAFIPIIPFFFGGGYPAVIASFVISTLAHFVIGAGKTVVTGLSPWKSGLEMMLIGLGEAAITYVLGLIFGIVAE